jgi:uncharacterized repeat protein (TIGR03803 family)
MGDFECRDIIVVKIRLKQLVTTSLAIVWLTISTAAQVIEPICSLTNTGFSSARNPRGGSLNLGPDGNLYGTTQYGGTGGFGTVFKVKTGGEFTVLASFDASTTGGDPYGGVTLGTDGNLYGTTQFSGPYGSGTVFRVTTNGVLTILYSFSRTVWNGSISTNADGSQPYAAVTLAPDGYLYGTTAAGGMYGEGTVFRMTTNGVLTTLFCFDALVSSATGPTNATGARPYGGLAWGPDRNLYGTTFLGGSKGDGTVFKITTDGTFTMLANFLGANGTEPASTLTLGPDNCLYGTTLNGGIYGDEGTVFRVTTNGVLTTLVSFNYDTGAAPQAGVTFGPDGNLYGTTSAGSSGSWGTIFRVTTNGVLTTLANFAQTNGFYPQCGVTFGLDGNLYGTTWAGGSSDPNAVGVIYRLNVGLAITNEPLSISRDVGGSVVLKLAGTPGRASRLWATTNLSVPAEQWQVLATNVMENGFMQFTDTNTSGASAKFYRVSTP